jgi:S-adenosylmethionine-diacylgycerolhomoserine-N-methlytransferase
MSAAPSLEAHAGLMDRIYRPQRHIYDLTRKFFLLGRDRLIANLALHRRSTLVEVGCGTGRNLIAIARRYPAARLYGLDASAAMLETAHAKVRAAGFADRIVLRQGLAEELSALAFGLEGFDHVVFSYSLSMIPDWRGALAAGIRTLCENGRWHVADFADLNGLGFLGKKALMAWLNAFHVSPRVELLAMLEGISPEKGALTLLAGRYAFVYRSAPHIPGNLVIAPCGAPTTAFS